MPERPSNWLSIELKRAREELQRIPAHLGGKGNRWAYFTEDELDTLALCMSATVGRIRINRIEPMLHEIGSELERRA